VGHDRPVVALPSVTGLKGERTMKRLATGLLVAAIGAALGPLASVASYVASDAKQAPGFEKLKALVGEWRGKDGDGKPVDASYSLTGANTAVMETLRMSDGASMITLYHSDGKRLMMTHYCLLGNQPRMQGAVDDRSLTFSLVDVTNLASRDAPHMHRLVMRFPDQDHLTHEWTMRASGLDKTETFRFQRQK
jgi:hypothetical protein